MAIAVKRPKLSFWEKMYFPALLGGLAITLRHMRKILSGEKKVTMQYPEERWDSHLPEHYRGAPTLVADDYGRERCVACQLCEFICPPRAITIKPEEIPSDEKWGKVEKRPKEFEIDMIRCIYCGLCQEVCPEQAIFLRKDYSISGYGRKEMVHDKAKLYELGGVRTGLVNKWNDKK
ncbi:MAG: NuoI/complex I 23 kDa subunit family protein [Chthoniobacterales bacterium]